MLTSVVLLTVFTAAPGTGRVAASASDCPPGFAYELRRLLTIELKAPVDAAAAPGDTAVNVDCARSDRYLVSLSAERREPASFDVDVSNLDPRAVPRAVALVVAEAIARLWSSPVAALEPQADAPPPVVEAPVPPPPASDDVEAGRLAVSLIGTGRSGELWLYGGGVAADIRVARYVGLRVDVAALRGSTSRTAGSVTATLVDGSLSADVRLDERRWMARLGVGVRAGWAMLSGTPTMGNTGGVSSGAMWGPQLGASVEWRPLDWLSLGLGLDGAVWAPRLEGTVIDDTPVRIGGLFGAAWLSAGVRW